MQNRETNVRSRRVILLLAIVGLLILAHDWWYSVERQARKLGSRQFSVQAWAQASQIQRGEMTASFLEQYDLSDFDSRKKVEALLGSQTAYFDYDSNVAYFVGPDTVQSMYGPGYLLVFEADKDDGKIERVFFFPRVK
ncbi:hypothetical protein [Massilia sp. HP4]|uniref:hypothetical protein n=1 Tax=Massilia sp. HP4 TaxID=2562316 RepID=UPI0010C11369|nr:hypothetical protein [Massilia sp. HP4]